jgi:hypothetical protein
MFLVVTIQCVKTAAQQFLHGNSGGGGGHLAFTAHDINLELRALNYAAKVEGGESVIICV